MKSFSRMIAPLALGAALIPSQVFAQATTESTTLHIYSADTGVMLPMPLLTQTFSKSSECSNMAEKVIKWLDVKTGKAACIGGTSLRQGLINNGAFNWSDSPR